MTSQFKIPASATEFKLTVGFYFAEIMNFKIIGYELDLFNYASKIYFYDIYNPELDKNSRNNANPIDSHYDVVMIPKLPVIRDLEFVNAESKSSITHAKYVHLKSQLGTRETRRMNLVMSEVSNDFEVIGFTFTVLNEQLAKKLKAEISLVKDEETQGYVLTIDSFKYNSNDLAEEEENNEVEISSVLEIKYTSKSGMENNLCHTLRVHLVVKFTPVYRVTLLKIASLDEKSFTMTIKVRNLLQDQSFFILSDSSKIGKMEIEAKQEQELTLDMAKLSWFDFRNRNLDMNNNESGSSRAVLSTSHILGNLINESLNLELNLRNKLSFRIKLDSRANLAKYADRLFFCPFDLRPELSARLDQQCTLIAFFEAKRNASDQDVGRFFEGYSLTCRIQKRKGGLRVVSNDFEVCLDVSFSRLQKIKFLVF